MWTREVENIRNEFIKEDKIFHDQRKDKDVVGDFSFFVVHSAYMARTYVDKVSAKFSPVGEIQAVDVVDNMNLVYEQDMDEDHYGKLRYKKNYDKFKYGVGVIACIGWDWVKKQNIWQTLDPRYIVVDPNGDYIEDEYSFIGYETFINEDQFEDDWDNVEELVTWVSEEIKKQRDAAKANADINLNESTDQGIYQIYYELAYEPDEKWVVRPCWSIWGNERRVLLKKWFPNPVFDWEKKNLSDMKLSDIVICDRWRPMKDSFFGHRLATFAAKIQVQKAKYSTLRYEKWRAELYPMYLVNSRLIKNKEDLEFGFNKMVMINALEWEDISNAMKPLVKDFRADNSYLVERDLDQQLTRVTGGLNGDLIQGNETERRETLGTNKLIQGNTDINLQHTTVIESWFEKKLALAWLRWYLQNFASWDQKLVEFNSALWVKFARLSKDQFLKIVDIHVTVTSAAQLEKENNEKRVALSNALNLFASLSLPEWVKRFLAREVGRASGVHDDILDATLMPQEIRAIQENQIMTSGIRVGIDRSDEHLTHLIIHRMAWVDTLEMANHIQAHLQAYIATWGKPWEVSEASQAAQSLQQSMAWQQLAQQQAITNGSMWVQ